ncbi:hypothetical protein BDZ89DRAFT_1063405, partial [Hymenopellis radicata]
MYPFLGTTKSGGKVAPSLQNLTFVSARSTSTIPRDGLNRLPSEISKALRYTSATRYEQDCRQPPTPNL